MVKKSKILQTLALQKFLGHRVGVIRGISEDSRKVKGDFIFVAIKGRTLDGHDYIDDAVKNGAKVVIGEKEVEVKGATYIKVLDSRESLGILASLWYRDPSQKLKVIGVTGTDGKTTTCHLIYHLLLKSGKKVGLISTIAAKIGAAEYETGLHVTNPDPVSLQEFLDKMVEAGCEYAVIEITSHGIDQKRIAGTKIDVAVLTNITHEHLDYHKTFEAYRDTKLKFLKMARDFVVLNKDDESFSYLEGKLRGKKIIIYERNKEVAGILPGIYNESNAAAAIAVVENLGISKKWAIEAIDLFVLPRGRLQKINLGQPFDIYIDFAHTPNALENVLGYLKKQTKRRLIAVFGCAGERDVEKRPMMAKISTDFADVSVFTAEDPRGENVNNIIDQMISGVKNKKAIVHKIPERGEAIAFVIQKIAQKGDTVVLCGKGHERSMAYGNIEYEWLDYEAVKMALNGEIKKIVRK